MKKLLYLITLVMIYLRSRGNILSAIAYDNNGFEMSSQEIQPT